MESEGGRIVSLRSTVARCYVLFERAERSTMHGTNAAAYPIIPTCCNVHSSTLNVHSTYTQRTLNVHSTYTQRTLNVHSTYTQRKATQRTLWNAWKPFAKVCCAVIVSSMTRLTINGSSGMILLRKLPISAPK
jgi:hypothetical protein